MKKPKIKSMKLLGLKPEVSLAEYLSGHNSSPPLRAEFLGRESIKAEKIQAQKIKVKAFKKYGEVIDWNGGGNRKNINLFRIIKRERKSRGWRIAYLIVRDRVIDKLEQHPDSLESFEPIKGRSILYVAGGRIPQKIEAFWLEKPVILKKGIWHGIVTVSAQTHVKITENNRVMLKYAKLGFKIQT